MKNFLIINGPNLNLLGKREPEIYGKLTLDEIKNYTAQKLDQKQINLEWFQSNIEGEIVNRLNSVLENNENWDAVIINPGAYAHTSVAILDALKALTLKIIEVHLTNTHQREEFRQHKLTARAANIIIEGPGKDAYYLAVLSQLDNHEITIR
ncbi:MAG: type II 3-dehydroquinate dehydratase [Pseudomonadota bacterium]